jgi:hypothetical protein
MIFHKQFRAEIFRKIAVFSSARFKKLAMEEKSGEKSAKQMAFSFVI